MVNHLTQALSTFIELESPPVEEVGVVGDQETSVHVPCETKSEG